MNKKLEIKLSYSDLIQVVLAMRKWADEYKRVGMNEKPILEIGNKFAALMDLADVIEKTNKLQEDLWKNNESIKEMMSLLQNEFDKKHNLSAKEVENLRPFDVYFSMSDN